MKSAKPTKLGSATVVLLAVASAGLGCESILGLTPGKGLCEGVTCPAKDACHLPGTCDEGTGQCSSPVAMDTTPCNDGDACTTGDACQGGVCTGAPKACAPPKACYTTSTCDPKTGQCSASVAMDQGPCDDGDPCTTGDACQSGACMPGTPETCTLQMPCHEHGAGTCDPKSGCSYPSLPDGTPCDDGSECTSDDTCQQGNCTGAPVTEGSLCGFGDSCTMTGTCTKGACAGGKIESDGTACTDGTVCTSNDTCKGGVCNPGADHSWARWDLKAAPPAPRYETTATVVFDQLTHLTWERNPPATDITWDGAKDHCTNLSFPGYAKGWRLPTRIELASIVDYTRFAPAIDTGFFVGQAAHYWTSSPRPDLPDQFWEVSFVHGYVGTDTHTSSVNLRVRCVR